MASLKQLATSSTCCSCSYASSVCSYNRAQPVFSQAERSRNHPGCCPTSHTAPSQPILQPTRARGSTHVCRALDPAIFQDILVGGAVITAISAALYAGLKKDPVPCDLCQGLGGVQCFGCGGEGKMTNLIKPEDLQKRTKRDIIGRNRNPRECRVCGGVGLTFCSRCKGSGYVSP